LTHCAYFDDELVIRLGKVVEQLGGGHRILGNSIDHGAGQLAGQTFERRAGNGTTNQGVFDYTQIHTGLARVGAQGGEIDHSETTVLCDDDRLGIRDFRGYFGNYRLLVVKIETHGQLLKNPNAEKSALAIRRPSFRNLDSVIG
jgi:hypothetical protein